MMASGLSEVQVKLWELDILKILASAWFLPSIGPIYGMPHS
jgi:hypothetical protein